MNAYDTTCSGVWEKIYKKKGDNTLNKIHTQRFHE